MVLRAMVSRSSYAVDANLRDSSVRMVDFVQVNCEIQDVAYDAVSPHNCLDLMSSVAIHALV